MAQPAAKEESPVLLSIRMPNPPCIDHLVKGSPPPDWLIHHLAKGKRYRTYASLWPDQTVIRVFDD